MIFTGGEPEKYLQFFEMDSGFIRKKNLKPDTANMLKASIEDTQLQLEAHSVLKQKGDAANEIVTDSGAEDADDIDEKR